MTDQEAETSKGSHWPTIWRWTRRGIGTAALTTVLLVALGVSGVVYWRQRAQGRAAAAKAAAESAQIERANEQFSPVFSAFDAAEADQPYDIDKTIRVIHDLDQALANRGSLESYLQDLATRDYRDVAPEVLDARKEIMEVLLQLYAKQTEADDKQELWDFTSELLLTAFSVVQVNGDASAVGPSGGVGVDSAQAAEILGQMRTDRLEHRALVRDITALQGDLVRAMTDYSTVYYRYVDEWDELSVLRDRAYLAAHNGDWQTTLEVSSLAVDRAPMEKEAHLLKAMALIELANPERDQEIVDLLSTYISDHPDSTAPAFQLLGAQHEKRGRLEEARLAFQQSAAYYPRQAAQLTDMLDPYKARDFLRKSREGSFILEQYKSTMLGAGYWSPDLRLAQILFDAGDDEGGKAKVLDHFSRRRNQQQWDFVLSDIAFCYDMLGPRFWQIFPEDSYLDLVVSETMMGSALNVSVDNRSDRTLRNASLLLALQFTDMYADDYEVLSAERTLPAVPAHETTSFGSIDVNVPLFGGDKTVDDIVRHRAILITNEAVLWVDTDEYKIEVAEGRVDAPRDAALPEGMAERFPEYQETVDGVVAGLTDAVSVEVESRYGSDNLLLTLPKELSMLRPLFRLKYGDQLLAADDNIIEGDSIQLRFKGVENFDGEDVQADDLELLVASPFGDISVNWVASGGVSWRYAGVTREEEAQ